MNSERRSHICLPCADSAGSLRAGPFSDGWLLPASAAESNPIDLHDNSHTFLAWLLFFVV